MEIKKNNIISLEIISLGSDGEGIAKADGFPIFIKDSVPGDVCEVRITKVKKKLAYAKILRIIKPSKDRVEAACSVAGPCGGCTLQTLVYKGQLEYKRERVTECFVRIGGIDRKTVTGITDETVGMEYPYRYRNKAQYPIGYDNSGELVAGFYAGRSHRIVSNGDCMLLPVEFAGICKALLDLMKEKGISAYDEETRVGLIRHLVLRKAFATGEIMLVLVLTSESIPYEEEIIKILSAAGNVKTIVLNINREDTNVILGRENRIIYGKGYITDTLCGLNYRISPLSFYQVNPYIAAKLYETALEFAGLTGNETVWDVCCGIGTITLFLAGHCKKIRGIEIIEDAINDAKVNAELNGIDNADFIVGAAEDILPKLTKANEDKPDVIILDPPRSGMERTALDAVIKAEPKRIVYVSCDPATLARDVKILSDSCYELKRVRPFDQFCQSAHVEVVVMLSRAEGEARAL
ncbi:MAG: 23S rRNA (uracil(1939)-C(5))-methyltransferase RlmD [Lachnospiraceae bacterium]|nr:23S rRNA (uracil(1939)-C(5))-methyltransferase RlmD [Lachnospiraceae bacterium]